VRVGELVVDRCRFRFEAGPRSPEREAAASEIPLVAAPMPLVAAPGGRVEILADFGEDPSSRRRELGQLRFVSEPMGRVWDVRVQRINTGYYFFTPIYAQGQERRSFHGSVTRGKREWLPDEYIPSSNPDSPAPPAVLLRMRDGPERQ
jgi:hypothetical protein